MKYIKLKDGHIRKLVQENEHNFVFEVELEHNRKTLSNCSKDFVIAQSHAIHELCDSFEVVRRIDGYTFKFRSYKKAFNRWFGDGWQGVSDDMYGLIKGKRVAVMTGYTEGKHHDRIEMELL